MIYVDMDLPEGVLLPDPEAAQDPGGIVFDAAGLELDDGALTGWRDLSGAHFARPAKPNDANAQDEFLGSRRVLRLREGVNCGFALEEIALAVPRISFAVLFASPIGRARSLVTVNPRDGRDYLFLTENEGVAELAFRDSDGSLAHPCAGSDAGLGLICASVDGAKMKLAVNGAPPHSSTATSKLSGGCHDLFIGCRSDRAGILKTLGEAQIARIWVWPGEDVFEGDTYDKLVDWWQKELAYGL